MHIHILLREIGEPFDFEVVNVTRKLRADGSDYRLVAPQGMVPLLKLDDGRELTENLVIAQYLCDRAGREDLMPAPKTEARYRVMQWQSFVATELHKGFGSLFWPVDDATKAFIRQRLVGRLAAVETALASRPFVTGDTFTAADAYLFVIASWTLYFGFDLSPLPQLRGFLQRVGQRPSVTATLAAEGPGLVSLLPA